MATRKLPKKPKRPRASASIGTWQRFDDRYKAWERKCSDIRNGHKKKETLVKKYASKY
jgi:hypothetical protein